MPQLPTRLDRAVPQSRRGVVGIDTSQIADAAQDVAQITAQGNQNLARGVGELGNSMQRAQNALDETAYTEARSKFLQAKIREDGAYEKDADWGTYETRYTGNLGKTKAELAAGIKNPKLRAAFEAETNVDLERGTQSIRAKAFERETRDGIDSLNLTIQDNVSAALSTKDKAASEAILKATQARIDSAVAAGYISEPGAKLLKRKTAQSYAQQRYQLMPPEEALAELIPGAAPVAGITQVPLTDKASESAINSQSDAETLRRIAQLESNGKADAVNPTSGASGLFQFMPETAAQYGLTDPKDPRAATDAAQRLLEDNRKSLRGALGREPTPAELYLAHQQGAGGAAALLANPDEPAIVALTAVYGNADRAREAIIQNGGTQNMTARQFTNLWKNKFNGGNGEPIGMVLSGEIPPGGWDFTQQNGTPADLLDPSVRGELIASLSKKMKEESDAARKAVAVEIALAEADQKNTAYQTGEVDKTYVAKAMAVDPVKGIALQRELESLAQQGNDQRMIATSSPVEDEAMLAAASLAANQDGPGSAEAVQRYGQLVDAVNRKRKALETDPAAYVVTTDAAAEMAFADIQGVDPEDPESAAKVRLAAETILQSQARLGVDNPRILPKQMAANIASMIEPKPGQSGEEAVLNIRAQAEQWGQHWPQIWSEIAGNVGDAGRVVAVMDPSQNLAAARLIEAGQQKDALEKQTQGTVGTAIKEAMATQFAEFLETFANTNSIGEGLRYTSQAELLARRYVVEGAEPDKAVKRAYDEIIDAAYDTSLGVRVPKQRMGPDGREIGYDVDAVAVGAEMAVRNLADIDPIFDDLGAGDAAQEQYIQSLQANHSWVNSPDGRGLALLDGFGRPVLKGGKPYALTFDDLVRTQGEFRPTEMMMP